MPEVFFPYVSQAGPTGTKLVIDPITRIEGHLRIEVQVDEGEVVDAWSSGTMFRGIEIVLRGRDPRDAWLFAQRICGVCTTVHALCSVRAVENALGIVIPDNARLVRNLIEGAQFIQDHVIHFYHLHAPDWVDIPNALQADPSATSALAQSISEWPNSSAQTFQATQERLQTLVDSGQLGIFGNAYWGHSAYQLPPEGNLLALAHYLEALSWQREIIRIHAILGGKNPHPQSYLVGGMSIPVGPSNGHGINADRITELRNLSNQALDFVAKVYIPDLLLVASLYKSWSQLGAGPRNYLSYGDFPDSVGGDASTLWLPRGIVSGTDLDAAPQVLDPQQIREYVAHSWYQYTGGDGVALAPIAR